MNSWMLESAVRNDIGKGRSNNEDNFYLNGRLMEKNQMDAGGLFECSTADSSQTFAVCDGMGGGKNGEDASYMTASSLSRYLRDGKMPYEHDQLQTMLREISDRIFEKNRQEEDVVGSTVSMAIFQDGAIRIAHVGDSRVYRLRGKGLTQLTVDQTEVQRMIAIGILTKEEARKSAKRHMINQYMGMSPEVMISPMITEAEPVREGDKYLLCSDGLHDVLEDEEIGSILGKASSAREAAKNLVDRALKLEGKDNITAMCVFVHAAKDVAKSEEKSSGKGRVGNVINALLLAASAVCLAGVVIDFLYTFVM